MLYHEIIQILKKIPCLKMFGWSDNQKAGLIHLSERKSNTDRLLQVNRLVGLCRHLKFTFVQMQEAMPEPSSITHLNCLVPERDVREIVPVDLIGSGVYVDSSHHLARYATLWR